MSDIVFDRHPIRVLDAIRRLSTPGTRLSFSRYKYVRQTLEDSRVEFWVDYPAVTDEWLVQELAALSPGEDLAINSKVQLGQTIFHLPMIDFSDLAPDHLEGLTKLMGPGATNEFVFFSSGRSFHAYGKSLLSQEAWVKFMATLLLCNLPGKADVIDSRWIGHRLFGGYSALRWSCNGDQYVKYPTLIENMESISPLNKKSKKSVLIIPDSS